MAGSLIETLSGEFDPSEYKDGYREALQAVIEAKVEGREVVQPTEDQPTSGTVVDLMAALRASVEAAKKGRPADAGSPGEAATKGPVKPAAKKAPAKTAPAKKAPAKSAPARSAPAKKAPAADKAPDKAPAKRARKSA